MNNAKEAFLQSWAQEYQTTVKILKAYPHDKQDLKPAEKCKTARELAWIFANEENVMMRGIAVGNIDWSKFQPTPATMQEAIAAYERGHAETVEMIKNISDADWNSTIAFMVAPKTPGQVLRSDLLWMLLHDQIHHRGQFSIYLRLAGAKVPSIYGPTADEPWM